MVTLLLFLMSFLAYGDDSICKPEIYLEGAEDLLKCLKHIEPNYLSSKFCEGRVKCEKHIEATKTVCVRLDKNSYNYSLITTYDNGHSTMTSGSDIPGSIGTCGMTPEEIMALDYYMASGYECLNAYLRSGKNKDLIKDNFISLVTSALEKLPNYEGFVRRGVDLPESVRKNHKAGNIVEYKGFTSTSTATGFTTTKDLFMIYSKTGKPIMSFGNSIESEILFKPSTNFKILKIINDKSKRIYVMKEVSTTESADETSSLETRILKLVESQPVIRKSKLKKYDSWACPPGNKPAEQKTIFQKIIPNMYMLEPEKQ